MATAMKSRIAAAVVTIIAGLAVHLHGGMLQPDLRDVLGDVLWAMMIMWLVSIALPGIRAASRALLALAICWAVELSQLYQADWINALRSHTLGHLVLGSSFDARDLVAYAAGVLIALILDRLTSRARAA